MTPQIITLVLWLFNLIITSLRHGKPRPEIGQKYNIYTTSASIIITAAILYWGGFFNVFFS